MEDSSGRSARVPSDIPDGKGDDIVARQLREAAMNEKDPELREKLWDEYRFYKFGTTGKKEDKKKDAGPDETGEKPAGGEESGEEEGSDVGKGESH